MDSNTRCVWLTGFVNGPGNSHHNELPESLELTRAHSLHTSPVALTLPVPEASVELSKAQIPEPNP